jgi:hypothetical protein
MNTVYIEIHPNRSRNEESAGRNSLRVKCSRQSTSRHPKLPDSFCKEFNLQVYENLTDGLVADITSQSGGLSNGHSVHTVSTKCPHKVFDSLLENGLTTSQLMLYREIIAVCSQIHTKHINTVWAERRIVEC